MSNFGYGGHHCFILVLHSLNVNLEFESKAAGTKYAAGEGPKGAFEVLVGGDAWIIYRNTKTGVLHWDFVSRPSAMIWSCSDNPERVLRVVSSASQ